MATYLSPSTNVQADSIQTLHLMNQPYSVRSDTANLMLVNHQAGAVAQNDPDENDNSQQHSYTSMGYGMLSQAHFQQQQQQQQQSALAAIYSAQQSPSVVFGNRLGGGGGQYGWTTSNELPFLPGSDASSLNQSMSGRLTSEQQQQLADFSLASQSNSIHGDQVSLLSKGTALGLNMPHVIDNGPTQALSLSLTPQQQQQQQQQQPIQIQYLENAQLPIASLSQYNRDDIGYRGNRLSNIEDLNQIRTVSIDAGLHSFMPQQGAGAGAGFITASKYLRAAQDLLDEVVSVGDALKNKTPRKNVGAESWMGANSLGTSTDIVTAVAAETSPQVRQELQLKKAKLVAMLEEVDRRYRIYNSQMQAIVSSFESAAGVGAAKSYTALALQTISRHFRCLRDAIAGQIRVAGRGLGEEQQSYQYRALQQLQMMQQHAWRPQRGLPERAVSVLRAWLFEHFLHPYPKDSDKILLAKQTGLTRNQVSNWFINARVRLWKPMVEEMYQEELKDSDATPNQRSDGTGDDGDDLRSGQRNSLKSRSEDVTSSAGDQGVELQHMARPSELSAAEETTTTDSSLLMHEMHSVKKARTSMDSFVTTKTEAYSEVHDPNIDYGVKEESKLNFPGMVRGLDVQGLGNYLSSSGAVRGMVMSGNNNVSLTLGLQHSDVLEAQQQQHYFHHLQGSGHGDTYNHMRLHDDISNQFTSGRQQRDLDSSTLTTVQDYYPSLTPSDSANNEVLQLQNGKHFSAHILQQRDFTS